MSCPLHFTAQGIPGYGTPDDRYVHRHGVPKRPIGMPPNSSRGDYTLVSYVNFLPSRCHFRRTSISCASSNHYRRNLNFLKQSRKGVSGSKNQPSEKINGYHEDFEESDSSNSKDGLTLQRNKAPAGSRQREILEILRRVQAQLRQRSPPVNKEKNQVDNSKGMSKESKAVESLLKLLKKQPDQPGNKNISSTEESITVKHEIQESPRSNPSRPKSSFSGRSPAPQANSVDRSGKWISLEAGNKTKSGSPTGSTFSELKVFDEMSDDESHDDNGRDEQRRVETIDLSGMKIVELRALAKSRGVRGFMKFKKHELIEVLSRSST